MRHSKISFLLSEAEFKLLKAVVYLEPSLGDGVAKAKFKNGNYRVRFNVVDLEDALEALPFSAGYAKSRAEVKETLELRDKIKRYLLLSRGMRQSAQHKRDFREFGQAAESAP